MKRAERQHRILTLLGKESGLSAGDLSRRFQVSRMTIHRDLQSLFEQGLLLRIHGGAVAKGVAHLSVKDFCSACERSLVPHQRSEVICADDSIVVACCAACGLRQYSALPTAERLLVSDQIGGRMLPAEEAFFLINSLASPCCKPSLLSFASESEVALFQAGFGGSIARLDEAVEFFRVAEGLSETRT